MMKYSSLVTIFCLLAVGARADPTADKIATLPGWSQQLPSPQWSGYLDVGSKHLHYWLVEAESQADTAPVVLWLNGGPGCSSLDGFIYEHGPFRTDPDDPTQLVRFNGTWAKLAHMLYLEAPAGVGFSYSDDPADYQTDDDKTAADNLAALKAFFSAFPRFKSHSLFITGESYAGVYVPTLAEAIVAAGKAGTWTGASLKGIAVGNGCSGHEIGVCGPDRWKYGTQYLLQTAFVSPPLKRQITSKCDFDASKPSSSCSALLDEMGEAVGHVNLYNVYGDCISGHTGRSSGLATHKVPLDVTGRGPDACIDSIAGSAYFNQPSVIEAAHVVKQPIPWSTCGNQIRYTSTRANLPRDTYPALVESIRVLIYNGDWDACVPHTDAEAWTEGMGFDVADPWHPWLYKNGTQVAGYAVRYAANNFTFITIKGGRHEVPEVRVPRRDTRTHPSSKRTHPWHIRRASYPVLAPLLLRRQTAPLQALEMLRRLIHDESF